MRSTSSIFVGVSHGSDSTMALITIYIISLIVLGVYIGWYVLFAQGVQLIQTGKYERAVHLYNWLLRLTPRHSMSRNNRGSARYHLKDIDNALRDYEQAVELNPKNHLAFSNKIALYLEIGETHKALTACTDMINRNPQYAHGFYCRGDVHWMMNSSDDAIEDCTHAIDLLTEQSLKTKKLWKRPRRRISECHFQRGLYFYHVGNLSMASADMGRAFELDPRNKIAVYNRGFFHSRAGNQELALADYEKAIQLDEQFPYPYAGRGKLYFEQGDWQAALENFTRASERESTQHYALAGLAITHHALGETQLAQEIWRDLLEKDDRHRQPGWLAEEYGWNPPLVRKAENLMTELDHGENTNSEADQ